MSAHPRLNVLQICHSYDGPFRSVCRLYTCALADHHITTVYLRGERRADVVEETGGDKVLFLDQGSLKGLKVVTIFRVASLLRKERFDVVIAHRYKPMYIVGLLSHFFPIKLLLGVAHEHGVFKRAARSLFLKYGCRDMNILAVSETVKNDVLEYLPFERIDNRVFTLHHGIDTDYKSELMTRKEARDALGLDQNAWYFGTVGRLVAKKRHEILIDAFARANLPGARLLIVGGGRREQELKQQAEGLGLDDRVAFAGEIAAAWRYLKAFDAFVLTSGAEEAFGIVLLEAMLAEVPVISSDAAGPKEVVGDAGILFAEGDAGDLAANMEKITGMTDEDIDSMTSAASARLLECFSVDAFNQRFWSLPPIARLVDKKE